MSVAKMWAAMLGSIVTALLGLGTIPVTGTWHLWLTILAAICTGIVTYAVPNRATYVRRVDDRL